MKRILKMLARLYPAAWRRRYGAEYEALIEDAEPRARDGVDVLWGAMKMRITARSFVRIVMPCALVGGLVAVGISFWKPPQYASQTMILSRNVTDDGICGDQVDLPAGLQGPRPGLCVYESDFKAYKKFMEGGGFNREFLGALIQKEGLYPRERTSRSLDAVTDEMRKNIFVRLSDKSPNGARLVIEFNYPQAEIAQTVDNELVSYAAWQVRGAVMTEFLNKELMTSGGSQRVRDQIEDVRRFTQRARSVPFDPSFPVLQAASLPSRPVGPSRIELSAIGLFGGLLGGLSLAATMTRLRARRQL